MADIKGFVPNSLVDWDGKVASVIFLGGCNFRCKFCSNKELVINNEKVKSMPFANIKNYLENNIDFIDGVVITGGEPTLNESLPELCREIKKLGLKVKLDTNGTSPEMIKELLDNDLVDFIAMDIKTSFENYKEIVGVEVDMEKIKKSIELLRDFGNYEFRITMFPEISKEDLVKIAKYLKEKNANKAFFIQQFRQEECLDEEAEKIKPYKKEQLESFAREIEGYFEKIKVRNA